jgi:urease accessory protein
MGWLGHLALRYQRDGDTTRAHDQHQGPLRVLKKLYPEGPGICHHVLVHPPGGVVGGDVLEVDIALQAGSHALITTPGATRFYRSDGDEAVQQATARLDEGARLEWLPLETIAYSGCRAHNRMRFELEPGAEMIGWDVLALGLPAAAQGFDAGHFEQRIELPGVWLERGRIAADDHLLLDSPLGLAGHPVMATLWFSAGRPIAQPQREALLDAARSTCSGHLLAASSGSTAPDGRLVVLRVLAPRVEPAMALLMAVRAHWRALTWGLAAQPPRVWRT